MSSEPVLPSPTLLIVGMRDVESDWSATRDAQKPANQGAEQIQVVNPEPAFDCTVPELAALPQSVNFTLSSVASSPCAAIEARHLVGRKTGKPKNGVMRHTSDGTGDGWVGGGGTCSVLCMDLRLPTERRTVRVNMRLASAK